MSIQKFGKTALKDQIKEDAKGSTSSTPSPDGENKDASNKPPKNPSSSKRRQGRPKGDPVVTRSLRIKEDINKRLEKEQQKSGLSYNEIANRAFDAYLK